MYSSTITKVIFLFIISPVLTCINISYADEIDCEQVLFEHETDNPEDKFRKGYCLYLSAEYEKALNNLDKLEKKLPQLEDYILFLKAETYSQQGETKKAIKHYKKINKKFPESTLKKISLNNLAEQYVKRRRYKNAIKNYWDLFEIESSGWNKAKHLNSIAEILERENKKTEAFKIYKEIWINYPYTTHSAKVYAMARNLGRNFSPSEDERTVRANKYFELSLWEPALNELMNLKSSTEDIKMKTAISLYKTGKYNEVSALLGELNSPEGLYWEGKSLGELGRIDESRKTLTAIHELFPNDNYAPLALYEAAFKDQQNARYKSAIEIYETLLTKYPESEKTPDAAWNLGWIYYKRGMYLKAFTIFSNYSYPPESINSQSLDYWKAKSLERLGRRFEAYNVYRTLALSNKFTYHSFLARKKIGYKPKTSAFSNLTAFTGEQKKEKALLLIDMGIYDLAKGEIKELEKKAKTQNEVMYVSKLYSDIRNYYKSVSLVDKINRQEALASSFPKAFSEYVEKFSEKYGLDELLVYSLIREESRFNKEAVSRSNARGLMQLIPVTAYETSDRLGVDFFDLEMLFNPEINVELGTYYLRKVLNRYRGEIPLGLASYNAGPNRVAEWVNEYGYYRFDEFVEKIPLDETKDYVKRILRSYGAYQALYEN